MEQVILPFFHLGVVSITRKDLGLTPEGGTDTATVEWVEGELGTITSSSTAVYRETPAGAIDGDNVLFTTAFPFQPGSTMVYHNGLLEVGYTEVPPQTIEFTVAPLFGDVLLLNFLIEG
jgi:hypothetical protein